MEESERMARIRAAIEELRDKHGRITGRMFVNAAKNPKHPCHHEFIWDNKKAADIQRIDRANELIRYVTVVVIDRTQKIVAPCYVRDPMKRGNEAGMIAITSSLLNRQHAEKIMLGELERCQAAIERARSVTNILDKTHRGLSLHLEEMLEQIVQIRRMMAAE